MSARDKIVNRIKKTKEIQMDEALKMFKEGQHEELMEKLFFSLPPRKSMKYVCDLFYKSQYRAYSLGMNRFKTAMDRYVDFGDLEALKVIQDKEDIFASYGQFDNIKFKLIEAAHYSNEMKAETLAFVLIEILGGEHWDDDDPKPDLTPFVTDLINLKWPGHPGLKVLFGSKE